MPNDAKLGLVVGVGLVIAVAVIFFQKDLGSSTPGSDKAAARVVNPIGPPPPLPRDAKRPAKAKTMSRTEAGEAQLAARNHTVAEGDTLFSLAESYYGDKEKFIDIYQANRRVLKTPDALPTGISLVIPAMPEGKEIADDAKSDDENR